MHFTGLTYRPPYEAESLLLQVTVGCSHNRCVYCSMYRDVGFAVSPLEEVEEDLREVAAFYPTSPKRVFLVNGDAFVLPTDQLLRIAKLIRSYLPNVSSIGAYAQVKNILSKDGEELEQLAQAGYSNINIGLESGLEDVLEFMDKGFTLTQARDAMARLHEAGLPFNVNIINGAAGPERVMEHAAANAALINDAKPTLLFVSPLHIDAGTPLWELVERGDFQECSLGQYIDEEMELLRRLDVQDCVFFGMHVSNPVPVLGILPQDKERLLAELEEGKAEYAPWMLESHPYKGSEGRILR